MSFCPECLQKNINSSLTVMGVDNKIRICENDNCVYVENCQLLKYVKDDISEIIEPKLELFVDQDDLDFPFSSDSETDNLTSKNVKNLEFNEYQVSSVKRHLQILFDTSVQTPGIFNWFCLPLMLKFNSKVCLFLIIHLNLFKSENYEIIQSLKEMYCKTEDTVNNIPKKLITLLSFKFSQYLYKEHFAFNLSNINVLNMPERILRSMTNFISTLENGNNYRSIYSFNENCNECDHKISYLKEDFSVRVINYFSCKENVFSYTTQCKKCIGKCTVSLKILRLADFIFIDLPHGSNHDFKSLMSTSLSTIPGDKLHLQAIIELQCPFPFEDIPEKVPILNEFIFKKNVRQRVQFRIHFRNTDGWYCIDQQSGLIVKNIFGSDVNINLSDIRLLVYGTCNNIKYFKQSIPPSILYKELKEYEKPPHGSVQYPHDEIKYWLHLFKYRDYHSSKSSLWRSKVMPLAQKITEQLNEHLCRKKERLKHRISSESISECILDDSVASENELIEEEDGNPRQMAEVSFRDLNEELCRQEVSEGRTHRSGKFVVCKAEDESTESCPAETTKKLLKNLKRALSPVRNIDHLIASKKMRMRKKK